jgi:G:T-mismatch repair DNA endonuclease (very short patch repair protein)
MERKKKEIFDNVHKKLIERFGKEEGTRRWFEYVSLKKLSAACTLQKYCVLLGCEEGNKKWEEHLRALKSRKTKTKKSYLSITHARFVKMFGDKEGTKKYLEYEPLMINRGPQLEKYIIIYGKEEGEKKWIEHNIKVKSRGTKQYYVDKYGAEDGEKKYLEKNSRLSVSEKSLRSVGKTDDEIIKIKKIHKENSLISEEKYIRQYGLEEGKARYHDLSERKGLNGVFGLNYWLKKCDNNLELAKQSLSDSQKRDINFFIKLYGEIEGREIFEQFVLKITKNWICNTSNSHGQLELEGFVRNTVSKCKTYGYKERWALFLNKEEIKMINQKVIYPDIVLINERIKAIIEYFGDFWHCHNSLFPDENSIHPEKNVTIKELREKDELKKSFFLKRGFLYHVVWESEWLQDKENAKSKVKRLIYEIEK